MNTEFLDNFVRASGKLKNKPALVLNADYRPLSYFPLSLWSWQDAVKAAYLERVDIVVLGILIHAFFHAVEPLNACNFNDGCN